MKDSDLDLSRLNFPEFKMPKINVTDYGINKKALESIGEANRERYQREVENNESLKAIVAYNDDISKYNRELVSLNEKILNKINSLDDTLLFLNKAFDKKSYSDKTLAQEHNALLLELITIIESKDPTKLQQFMGGIGAPIGVALTVEYLKMKLGLVGM